MKKLVSIFIVAVLFVSAMYAEKSIIDQAFAKYAKVEGATVVDINGFLLNLAAKHDNNLKSLNLTGIKVLTIENPEINKDINFYAELVPNLVLSEYKELIRVHNSDEQVVMLLKEKGDSVEEFLIIIGGAENTLVKISGDLNKDDFEELAELADVNVSFD